MFRHIWKYCNLQVWALGGKMIYVMFIESNDNFQLLSTFIGNS